jgi:Ca2+-binding RTX toxin-like protein
VANLVTLASDNTNVGFIKSKLAIAVTTNSLYVGSSVAVAIGTAGNDTVKVEKDAADLYVLGGAGADRIVEKGTLATRSTDGGAGIDTLVFTNGAGYTSTALSGGGYQIKVSGAAAGKIYGVERVVTRNGIFGADGAVIASFSAVAKQMGAAGATVAQADAGGFHIITAANGTSAVAGTSADDLILAGNGSRSIAGAAGNDVIFVNSSASGAGNKVTINGGSGADVMVGGYGDEIYIVDNAADTISDLGGTDTVKASVSYTLSEGLENLTLTSSALGGAGNSGANTLTGNALDNTLYGLDGIDALVGGDGNDTLDGGAGADTMTGGVGNDTYYVDDIGDNVVETVSGGTGDQIYSSVSYGLSGRYVEKLTLTGATNINATGNGQVNTLIGNAGKNVLDGGLANDTLSGGAGNDTFLFDSALGTANIDSITDFTLGADLIALDKSVFTALGADGALASSAFAKSKTATTTTQRILYDSASGDLYYDKDGSGTAAAVRFAHVTAGLGLTASSFSVQG